MRRVASFSSRLIWFAFKPLVLPSMFGIAYTPFVFAAARCWLRNKHQSLRRNAEEL
jgi:hypothetical protein